MQEPVSESNNSRSTGRTIGIVAVVGLLIISAVAYASSNKQEMAEDKGQPSVAADATVLPSPSSAPSAVMGYKDGEYSADGEYISPGGLEHIAVTLTVVGGTVTEAKVVSKAERKDSKTYQGIFIENYKPQVVGKKLAELKLDKVSGSSLTPKGFNSAVAKIKSQAS